MCRLGPKGYSASPSASPSKGSIAIGQLGAKSGAGAAGASLGSLVVALLGCVAALAVAGA